MNSEIVEALRGVLQQTQDHDRDWEELGPKVMLAETAVKGYPELIKRVEELERRVNKLEQKRLRSPYHHIQGKTDAGDSDAT